MSGTSRLFRAYNWISQCVIWELVFRALLSLLCWQSAYFIISLMDITGLRLVKMEDGKASNIPFISLADPAFIWIYLLGIIVASLMLFYFRKDNRKQVDEAFKILKEDVLGVFLGVASITLIYAIFIAKNKLDLCWPAVAYMVCFLLLKSLRKS